MSEHTFSSVQLYADHHPDHSMETGGDGNKVKVELPGMVHIGFIVDGVKVPAVVRKASGLFADLERAKQTGPSVVQSQDDPQQQA